MTADLEVCSQKLSINRSKVGIGNAYQRHLHVRRGGDNPCGVRPARSHLFSAREEESALHVFPIPGLLLVTAPMDSQKPSMWFPAITTYLGYAVLISFGHLRDFFASITGYSRYNDGPVRRVRPTFYRSFKLIFIEHDTLFTAFAGFRPAITELGKLLHATSVSPHTGQAAHHYFCSKASRKRSHFLNQDCWNRPIEGPPVAGKLKVVERKSADGNVTFQ